MRSIVVLLVLSGLVSASLAQGNFGQFKGEVVAKFMRDGRNMQLEKPFGYVDPKGREWNVPAGTTTDGASVPQFFWALFPPFTGRYRAAAVIHDYYCQTKSRGWKETHEVFYLASRAAGVGEKTAKAMYGAVYNFGPRWGIGMAARGPGAEVYKTAEQQRQFFRDLDAWIGKENPSLEDIAKRLDSVGVTGKAK
jgi:hypothetical protein